MREVACVCVLLGFCGGCRALANREGLTGAAREVRGWADALVAAPAATSPARSAASPTAGEPHPAPPLDVPESQPGGASAQPVSVATTPTTEPDLDLSPLDGPEPAPEPTEAPSGPLDALRTLLLPPPRVGSDVAAPETPQAHPTPARAAWQARNRDAPAAAGAASEHDGDDAPERPVKAIRPRRLPQPAIPLPADAAGRPTAGARPSEQPLTWHKPRS